jgi:CheY-like chemotaxis protein
MAFARKSVLQPRPVDMAALIQETAGLLSGSLPRSIAVVTRVETALPWVYGDPTQLQQVLLNLCVNARDAMPDGGTLTLSAAPIVDVAFSGRRAEGTSSGVMVEVTDTGMGMNEEVQQHLFEPFFTTKDPGKGTGLGLSVVFGIVRSHGGRVTVESRPGKGTRFSITLPLASGRKPTTRRVSDGRSAESSAEHKAVASPSASSSASSWLQKAVPFGGTESILLVDDDAMLRDTTRQLLQNLGYKVTTAAGGTEALELLDGGMFPQIILLDVVMPGFAGLPLLKEMKKRLPSVPVLLVSGYSTDKTVQDMLDFGAVELVQKPFSMEALAGAVRRALELPARS